MASTFIEPGTAATYDFGFWLNGTSTTGTGAITSDSQAIFGGIRSIKLASGVSNGQCYCISPGSIMADAGRRFTLGIRYTGTISPSAGGADFISVANFGGGTLVFRIGINSSGKLVIMNDTGTALATGTTVLSTSTDYQISCAYTITSTTVNSITVYLNGTSEVVGTNVTLNFTGGDVLIFGIGVNGNTVGSNVVIFGAHFYVDDASSGHIGTVRVTEKEPISNGTTNGMTGSGTPSGLGTGNARYVNERPVNTSNFVSVIGAGSAITEEYNIQTVSQGDVDITGATIVDYTGWVINKALIAETGKIIVNNVQTNISITTGTSIFTKIAGSSTYPAGTGTDIGMVTSTTVTTVTLYECGLVVAYIPASGTRRFRTLLGVGI